MIHTNTCVCVCMYVYVCMYASFSLFIVLKIEGRSMKYDDTAFHTSNYVIVIPPP